MCVSAVVETERSQVAALLGLGTLASAGDASDGAGDLPRRLEARHPAWVVRLGRSGRLVAERMRFNPYVARRRSLGGDPWTSTLLGANHGLVVLRTFSEWVSARRLLELGLIDPHEVHCAFNRVAPHPGWAADRLLLANFHAAGPLLVPVLFDETAGERQFVVVTDDPPALLQPTGLAQAPRALGLEAAHEWLQVVDADDPFAIDFEEVLEDGKAAAYTFSLYKSA